MIAILSRDTAWEVWGVGLGGSNPHKVVGAIGTSQANSTNIVGWKNGRFLIGGYQGNWDPYFISDSGGMLERIIDDKMGMDDKPTDWWMP